jgi:hypothetical protein
VVEKYGWPDKSRVGWTGEEHAFQLVLDADDDRPLQKRCVELLKKAGRKDAASAIYLAVLTDNLRIAEGKKQLYGTDLVWRGDECVPSPIEDEANVDKRRKDIGLNSLAEHMEISRKIHQKIDPKKP